MEELFDTEFGYNYRSFTGSSGTWTIIGTEAKKSVKGSIDTFKSDKEEKRTYKREQVIAQYEAGKIMPVETSLITIPKHDSKEFKKKLGRQK